MYNNMRVWEQALDANERLHFSAEELNVSALGAIVENDLIRSELKHKIDTPKLSNSRQVASYSWYMPERLDSISVDQVSATLDLQSGLTLKAKLLIAADGANSHVRRKLNLPSSKRSYAQYAVVAQIRTEKPHQHTAYQRFHNKQILALLPLANDHCSIVWSCSKSRAEELLALDEKEFARAITEFSQSVLGDIELVSAVKAFPLQLMHVRQYVDERLVLCGDAAHALHPLAGQGVNLGLLDAASLANVIKVAWEGNYDLGDLSVLRRYARERKANNVQMLAGLDSLFSIFQSDNPLMQEIRRAGMGAFNRLTLVKHAVVQQALGLKQL